VWCSHEILENRDEIRTTQPVLKAFKHAILTWMSRHRSRGRIFLSFASSERDTARRVAVALRSQKFQVFFDETDLPAGSDFNSRIEAAIEAADAIVFLLSPKFLSEGRYTRAELGLAEMKWPTPEGRVLAVSAVPIDLGALPPYLSPLTVLQPNGPIATEVAFAVNALRRWASQRHLAMLTSTSLAILAGILSWVAFEALERQELSTARADILTELRSNAKVVTDLKESATSLASTVQIVASSVRNPGIEVLATLFPQTNIEGSTAPDGPDTRANLYNEVIDSLAASGLLEDTVQVERALAACQAIARTISRTQKTATSLADLDGTRYRIETERWQLNRGLILSADPDWATEMSDLIDSMNSLRRDYDRVASAAVEYLDAMHRFCTELKVNRATMSEVLAVERLTFNFLLTYLEEATRVLEGIVPKLNAIWDETSPDAE